MRIPYHSYLVLPVITITLVLGELSTFVEAQETQLLERVGKIFSIDDSSRLAQERQRFAKDFSELTFNNAESRELAQAVIEKLDQISKSKDVPISTSVNAALLLGELKLSDNKQTPSVIKFLTELVFDENVQPAVRVAAFTGLAEQAATATGNQSATLLETFTKVAALDESALPTISRNWIQERLLEISGTLIKKLSEDKSALDPLKVTTLKLLRDNTRPVNLRVRALSLIATMTRAGLTLSTADIQGLNEQSEAVAVAAAQEDLTVIERQQLQAKLSGTGAQSGMPAGDPLTGATNYISEAACLQMSWRLVSLANAIDSIADGLDDEKVKGALRKNVGTWRKLGFEIYKKPSDTSAIAAIKALIPEAKATLEASEYGNSPDNSFSPFQLR